LASLRFNEREQIPANVFLEHSRVKPWLMEIAGPSGVFAATATQRRKLKGLDAEIELRGM
jgi:hypothetical protein